MVVAWFTLIATAKLQVGDPCDVGDHENNNGSYGPHPDDCSKYLQCLHGTYGERSCSPGTHWNVEEGACDWPQKAKCVEFDTEQRDVVGGPCSVGDHADNAGLYVAHPSECGKYLQCLHGTFGERPCPEGLHWDKEQGACNWPAKANCVQTANKQPMYPVPPIRYV